MKIFCIIVTYNGIHKDWIKKCLISLQESSQTAQVIVVDNKSTDGTVEYIKDNHPEVLLVCSGENLGFGGANNLGLKKALELGGDYFFLLNQDAWIEPTTLEVLVSVSKKHPGYGILSPLQLDGTGDRLEWGFSNSIGYDYNIDFFSDFVLDKPKKEVYSTTESYAASWFITKECLRKVGGFNPSFFHYGEDDNYCRRVLYKELKVGVTPLSSICHDTYHKPENDFKSYFETEKRRIVQLLSDPAGTVSLPTILKQLRNKKLKSLLLLDKAMFAAYRQLHAYLEENGLEIEANKARSVSNDSYIFLNE